METDGLKAPVGDAGHHRFTRRSVLVRAATGGAAMATMSAVGLGMRSADAQEATPSTHSHGATSSTAEATPAVMTPTFVEGEDLREPEVRESVDGILDTTLTARLGPATVGGQPVTTWAYDGMVPAPTLKFKSGDTVRVKIVNELDEMTNFHTHGFHVSPEGNSDNIFVMIHPGETFQYEYKMPTNHPPGIYWYHPHPHGISEGQVAGGLAGAIINSGALDDLPGVAGLPEHLILIQATQFGEDGVVLPPGAQSPTTQMHLVNGQLRPVIRMRPGETQRWRIANISAGNFYNVALASHALFQIADDANPYDKVQMSNSAVLGPGERTEVLIQASNKPGTYDFRSLLWGDGFQAMPDILLATVIVEGEPVDPIVLPTFLIPFEDLSKLEVDNTRKITFQIVGSPAQFMIDGKLFDENRVDQTVKLGALEEWVIQNDSEDWHPFHIHVNDFQVIAINGDPIVSHSREDTYKVPPHGGSITMRTRFLDFTGKFVYHCHILYHEDHSMMGVVEVVP